MNFKKKITILLDSMMTICLLFLMALQVTGDEYHEWLGAGMFLLFVAHNLLNRGWYKALFKGRYTAVRVFRLLVNFAVLFAILGTGCSGIILSRYLFDFLPISSGMAVARKLHLAGSYWSFVLMSVHLGMHWSMVVGRLPFKKEAVFWLGRVFAAASAIYGGVLFGQAEIFHNMFLRNEFAILDYETAGARILVQNLVMMSTWVFVGHYLTRGIGRFSVPREKKPQEKLSAMASVFAAIAMTVCAALLTPQKQENAWTDAAGESAQTQMSSEQESEEGGQAEATAAEEVVTEASASGEAGETAERTETMASDEFIYITGGTYEMGSPDSENWRTADETLHTVTVSDFYMSAYELTQAEYEAVMGNNPSTFDGARLPVENVSWLDAVTYCNARSEAEGLTPAYLIEENAGKKTVLWNRGADGYRLPTEAEWEYACRANTTTPFHTETSISAEEANYYGHYPYEIEGNYFTQSNLTTKPGQYRQTTVEVDSFSPNAWGLYNMHGNVSEWVWDYYGSYDTQTSENPTGPQTGTLRIYRGGGWNDFAKNIRSAYRATMEEDMGSFNIGIRLVRNAFAGEEEIVGAQSDVRAASEEAGAGNVLIAYFSWGGNTQGVAEEIQAQTGADLFEITLVEPYSSDYNTVLDQAQHDQNIQARPEIEEHIDNMDAYDTILIGYPNWWASIPMPIASFLEAYDFSGKTIIPFCSHGGGRFGQSQTAIAKLAPNSAMGIGLSVHYSGGSSLSSDVAEWLEINGL